MDAFVARQPIFDRQLSVRAYELLFRSGFDTIACFEDPDQATSKVISDTLFLPRLDTLTGGRPAFINITRDLLVDERVSLLPPATTVLEIVESVEPDAELESVCRYLKSKGYKLALDDFRFDARWQPILEVVDIVKVDALATGHEERAALVRRLRPLGVTLLAEKVETHEVFRETLALGYGLFQGYFFARPTTVSARDIPGSKLNYLQILREIHKSDLDFHALEAVIEREVALSYKLLRYLDASFFGWRGTVGSIRHALMLLGEREIKKWASVVALAGMASDKPGELIAQALLRARFCELLAPVAGHEQRASDLFLMGIFSLMDAILDLPLPEVLKGIPIAEDAKAALLGDPGPLRDVFDLTISYTAGDWAALAERCSRLGVDEAELPPLFAEAARWASGNAGLSEFSQAA